MSMRWRILLLVLAVLAALAYGVATRERPDNSIKGAADITSNAPRFGTLEQLVHASDEIVLAEVTAVTPGRTISDPSNASARIKTQLVELHVVQTLQGAPATPLVLEQEATLADGTPVRVDGVAPVTEGQRGVFFLVRSSALDVPYRALVGPQGRYIVQGDKLAAAIDDDFTRAIVDAGGPALIRAVAAVRQGP